MEKSVRILINDINGQRSITVSSGTLLIDALRKNGILVNASCGGHGICGKCRVRVGEEEALACQYSVEDDVFVDMPDDFYDRNAALSGGGGELKYHDAYLNSEDNSKMKLGIAIDIGTTTLGFSLVDLETSSEIAKITSLNPQVSFGADVLTRIKAALDGEYDAITSSVRKALYDGVEVLLDKSMGKGSIGAFGDIRSVCLAGNTTMFHFLLTYPVEGLGVFPFKPFFCGFDTRWISDVPIYFLPGISAFVGADIVSGMYSLGFHESEDIQMLVDLGTNGEMAVGNKDKIMVASTAAGPAFEMLGMRFGTDVIRLVSTLKARGIIDDTGLLKEEYFESGFPVANNLYLTQDNIREIQYAKAATRAGIEMLLERSGFGVDEIKKVYVAGNFGSNLDLLAAVSIGMIPEELADKAAAATNTSLDGAVRFLCEAYSGDVSEMGSEKLTDGTDFESDVSSVSGEDFPSQESYLSYKNHKTIGEKLQKIIDVSENINLALEDEFNELYLRYMYI